MAKARLSLEKEVQEVFACIDQKRNFLLSGGAGSGKTYSLVQTIQQAIDEHPTVRIACITFTNAAVKQIQGRITSNNLAVSTIHDFLWENIKHFQKELKACLIDLINDEQVTEFKVDAALPVPADFFKDLKGGIQYKEYLKLAEGIISHEELLIVANALFEKYPKLCDVVIDKFRFIFIDEYQDTSKLVVRILLEHFKKSTRKNTIGFFGDAMQSIYEDSIGYLGPYVGDEQDKVKEIKKEQNRRNPTKVIDLANRLRTDGLAQAPSTDPSAPNMTPGGIVKEGKIKFIYSSNPDLAPIRSYLTENQHWDFSDSSKTKELNLTHNLIADKAGFRSLMDIYDKDGILDLKGKITKAIKEKDIATTDDDTFGDVIDRVNLDIKPNTVLGRFLADNQDLYQKARAYKFSDFRRIYADKDQLLDDKKQNEEDENKPRSKRDGLMKHLFKIQNTIHLYNSKRFNEFLRVTDFAISKVADKVALQQKIHELLNTSDKTIGEVILLAHESGICLLDDNYTRFTISSAYLFDRIKGVKYSEFQKLYDYLEGRTPFSTQHKTKGDEYDNVLVILDNGKWNQYNFENLFLDGGSASVLVRTQKIFWGYPEFCVFRIC